MLRIVIAPVGKNGKSEKAPNIPSSPDPFNASDQPPPNQPKTDVPKSRPKYDVEKVSQQVSGYMGPEMGPFECGNCIHFEVPRSCGIVSGDIDPKGHCNNYESSGPEEAKAHEAEELPQEEAAEQEEIGPSETL